MTHSILDHNVPVLREHEEDGSTAGVSVSLPMRSVLVIAVDDGMSFHERLCCSLFGTLA